MSGFKKGIILFIFSLVLVLPSAASARYTLDQARADAKSRLNQLPVGMDSAQGFIGLGVRALMSFMGAIMFALVVYAGVLWMTAAGNEEKIGKAKKIITWSALGIAVMLGSYVIINFVFSQIKSP